ncbi:MAG: hypothetical protein EHM33_25185, partial [Chloroflexi bacterium]
MTDNRKNAIVLIGVVILLCASGSFLFFARSEPDIFTPGTVRSTPAVDGESTPQPSDDPEDKYGIDLELRDGKPQPQEPEGLPLATGEPRSLEEINLILARLPDLAANPDEQTDFNFPVELLPAPRP